MDNCTDKTKSILNKTTSFLPFGDQIIKIMVPYKLEFSLKYHGRNRQMAEALIKRIKVDLASRFSQHPSVPTCYRDTLYPELSSPGPGLPFPQQQFPT